MMISDSLMTSRFTVSQLNTMVKELLESAIGTVWLEGEISNFSQPVSGHWYFTLKDAHAQIRCAMFRNQNIRSTFTPQNGQHVLARASLTLYELRGDYQLIVEQISPAGQGELQLRYEQLKNTLSNEGLFAQQHKKPLPYPATAVGLITSSTGAALHDMLNVLRRRDKSLHIIIYPTAVQGNDAAPQIADMILLANQRKECDVLIVARGGGSLEDLWAFNEEIVARAIFASDIPIVSAIGHEVDVTIADFVADLRAPTPSAAAELVSQNQADRQKQLEIQRQKMGMAIDYFLAQLNGRFNRLHARLQQQHPQLKLSRQHNQLFLQIKRLEKAVQNQFEQKQKRFQALQITLNKLIPTSSYYIAQQQLQDMQNALQRALENTLQQKEKQLLLAATKLDSVSPLATLSRGYSITKKTDTVIIKSVQQVSLDDTLVTCLQDGFIHSQIVSITPQEK